MGSELLEIGVKMKKGVVFTVRGCFRSVCNHPFLVGMLCFLLFLYRSSPYIFSLLVSASPILVCTAVLLGTLLSFGEPNIPEIEIEEKTTRDAVSIKVGLSGDATVVEKNESFYVERFSEKRSDEVERSAVRPDLSKDTALLIEERSREVEELREDDLRYKGKNIELNEEILNDEGVVEHHYAPIANDEVLGSDDDEKSEADSFDSEKVNVDSLDSPPHSPWRRAEEREDEEEPVGKQEDEDEHHDDDDDDDDGYSGSDRAESSSPDASMADIMPMLDELHPLLDQEAPQRVHTSRGDSDGHESDDDDTENHEDVEVADDENEDEEDDVQGDKEEQLESAISWTEEDQKNLMDLGSSEIERNQRLENLILRRRARKNTSMFPERNLIDLEGVDLHFNIAPISTRRQNPFDLPDNSGLPPIPGSAPSILLPRRNPFDIPYDSSEEKPDLVGDGFQEEFTSFQTREAPVFRRRESFNVGPSLFAPNRRDVKMRPYFVPERPDSESSSFSVFQRQSSGLSDSKVSSGPETESITSVEDDAVDKKLSEEDIEQEVEAISQKEEVTEEGSSREPQLIFQPEEVNEENDNQEQLIPKMESDNEHVESDTEHVGHGSESSEDEDSIELGQAEKRDVKFSELELRLGDVADHHQLQQQQQRVEQRYSRDSSSSSLSEVSERVFVETDGIAEERVISTQTSVESTDLRMARTLINDVPQRHPIYDSSPREFRQNGSSSSVSSVHSESDQGFPPVMVKRTVSSSSDDKNIDTLVGSSEEQNVDQSQKDKSFEGQLREEHSTGVEEIIQSPPSAEGSTSLFYDKAMDEPVFKHLNEMQASSTTVENMHEIQEFDREILSNVSSSLSPNFISIPSSGASHTNFSHNDLQTIVEEVDEIKEIDEGLLSELDNVGDFGINRWEASSSEFHEQKGSVISVEENKTEDDVYSENSREDMDIHEEDIKDISEQQTPQTNIAEHIDVSKMEIDERDGQDSLDQEAPENETLSKEIEVPHTDSVVNHNYEDTIHVISEIEVGSKQCVDSVSKNAAETEMMVRAAEVSNQGIVDKEITDGLPELEASRIEDIERAFNAEVSYQGQVGKEITDGMPELEASRIEDIELAFKQISAEEIEKPIVLEPVAEEAVIEHSEKDPDHEISVLEIRPIEDDATLGHKPVDLEPRQAEPVAEKTVTESSEMDTSHDTLALEVRAIEDDATLDYKPAVLEPPQAELVAAEIVTAHSETDHTREIPVLEARPIEGDASLECKPDDLKQALTGPVPGETVVEHSETDPTHEKSVLEVRPMEDDATLNNNQLGEESTGTHNVPDPVDRTLSLVEPRETQGSSSELHVSDPIPSKGTVSPPKEALDGNIEKQLNLNSVDGSIEVKADQVGSYVNESIEPDNKVEAPKDLHSATSVKEKGKLSRTSSSSSSSSSESSDSDKD